MNKQLFFLDTETDAQQLELSIRRAMVSSHLLMRFLGKLRIDSAVEKATLTFDMWGYSERVFMKKVNDEWN